MTTLTRVWVFVACLWAISQLCQLWRLAPGVGLWRASELALSPRVARGLARVGSWAQSRLHLRSSLAHSARSWASRMRRISALTASISAFMASSNSRVRVRETVSLLRFHAASTSLSLAASIAGVRMMLLVQRRGLAIRPRAERHLNGLARGDSDSGFVQSNAEPASLHWAIAEGDRLALGVHGDGDLHLIHHAQSLPLGYSWCQ
jgi:hypothetical protein